MSDELIAFKRLTKTQIREIDKLQSEYFTEFMHLFDPPLPEGVIERLEIIVESANISEKDVVLDVGTGTGILIPLIKEHCPSLIYANDLSRSMLESIKRHHPDVKTIDGDIRDLTLPNRSIDVVFINACYPNIADKHGCFLNIKRMARDGCRVIISHPMGISFIRFLQEKMPFPVDNFPENKTMAKALFAPYGFHVSDFVSEDKLYILVLKG